MKNLLNKFLRPALVRSVGLWKLGDKVLICPYARTKDGVGTAMEELAVTNIADPLDLGTKTLVMLGKCIDNVPDDYSRANTNGICVILEEAQMKSWRTFHRKSVGIRMIQMPGSKSLMVQVDKKIGSASYPVEEKQRTCSVEPLDIGNTAALAFADAEEENEDS